MYRIYASNVKEVNSLSDFPAPVAGTIPLENGVRYRLNADIITPYNFSIDVGASVYIESSNIITNRLIYVGTGALFTGSFIATLRLIDLLCTSPTGGSAFSITGADFNNTFVSLSTTIFVDFSSIGTIFNCFQLGILVQFSDCGQGLICDHPSFVNFNGSGWKNQTKDTSCTFDHTTDTVLATTHNMYDNDRIRFKTDGTLPTGLSSGVTDINGAVIDNGDGTIRFTTTAPHGFLTGQTVTLRDTTNYNRFYEIVAVPTTTTFDIREVYTAETITNGIAHLVYFIINRTANDFQVSLIKGGAVVNFTDNGTGNHEFYENSIMITLRNNTVTGVDYSVNMINGGFNCSTTPDVTGMDLEPTIVNTDIVSSRLTANAFNNKQSFTGSSLLQDQPGFKFVGNTYQADSAQIGFAYFQNNAIVTPLTKDTWKQITEPTYITTVDERTTISSNGIMTQTGDEEIDIEVQAEFSIEGNTAVAKQYEIAFFKDGVILTESISVPIEITNKFARISTFDIVRMKKGTTIDCRIRNSTNNEDIIVISGKFFRTS